MVILSLPLIQEGQLSVSGERLCTLVLVNHLDAKPAQEKVWPGKLTMLDMTWVDRAIKPQHKHRQNLFS